MVKHISGFGLLVKLAFSIINLSFICNSGIIEPDGIYRGSAKNDLQEETKKVNRMRRPHSFKKLLTEADIKLIKS